MDQNSQSYREKLYLNKQQNKKLWTLSEIHCWATVTETIINQYLCWNIQFSSISHNLKDILIVGEMLLVSFQWEMEDIECYLGYPFMCLNPHQQACQSFECDYFESSQCLYLPPYFFYVSFPPSNNGYITFLLSQIYSQLFKMRMG